MKIKVCKDTASKTVKEILFTQLGLSRGQVVWLKNNNGIRVNDTPVTVRYKLSVDDILELDLEDREESVENKITPVYHELNILYEDDDVVCVDKPTGMPTHPSHNHRDDTLANALMYHYRQKGIPFVFRAVNRLDSDTSGVVLVAKNRAAAWKLSRSMQNNEFKKQYIAVLCGSIEPKSGKIEAYIKRKEDSIIFRTASSEGNDSEYALTYYDTLEHYNDCSVVRVCPITGRTHQIRVHFSHIGYPLYGDGLYGKADELGLMLHAQSLAFPLPSGKHITVRADLPKRFEELRRKNEAEKISG